MDFFEKIFAETVKNCLKGNLLAMNINDGKLTVTMFKQKEETLKSFA